jgi:CubicO group peptidase (beta-lactamase class C family)
VTARPPAGLTLANWDLGGELSAWAYLHAGELFEHVEIPAGRSVLDLPDAPADIGRVSVDSGVDLDRYLATGPVDGVVIVHRGRLVYERYPRMSPGQRHFLMSVTKAFTSALVGVLEDRGQLDVTWPVDAVIPELAGSGWSGVPIIDVLDMASGIDCPEVDDPAAYTDPDHAFFRFEATLGLRPGSTASTYDLVAGLPSRRRHGEAYEYTSVNTFVLSWLVERVTGGSFAEALEREIWSRIGAEAPAQLCVSSLGAPVSHAGLSVRLRDLARFGLLFTPSTPAPVVSSAQLRRIRAGRRPELFDRSVDLPAQARTAFADGLPPASRQWNWVDDDGDMFKSGFGGQGLYVAPRRDLVIAFAGTPRADGSANRLRWYARQLARTFS